MSGRSWLHVITNFEVNDYQISSLPDFELIWSDIMELYQMLPDFRIKSFECIDSMEGYLLHLEDTPGCRAAINDLFHAIYPLKESSALFGLDSVVALARAMENVLVRVGKGEMPSDESLITLLLSCCSHMRTLIRQTSTDLKAVRI